MEASIRCVNVVVNHSWGPQSLEATEKGFMYLRGLILWRSTIDAMIGGLLLAANLPRVKSPIAADRRCGHFTFQFIIPQVKWLLIPRHRDISARVEAPMA